MNSISLFYALIKNSKKIVEASGVIYVTLTKVLEILKLLESKSNDTKLGKILDQYLPVVISVIEKILGIFNKYGKYIGFVAPAAVPVSAQSESDEDDLKDHLEDLSKMLDKY
jgi:uncharacterized membrane protein